MRDFELLTDKEKGSRTRTEICGYVFKGGRKAYGHKILCSVVGCPSAPGHGGLLCDKHLKERELNLP